MRVLGIESSSTTASVAIIEDNRLISEYTMNNTLKHSKTLMPMLEDMLKRLEADIKSVDLVAVSEGPGSFTGLRIGSATAKGIAHGLGIPVASIPTLEVLASTVTMTNVVVGVIVFARAREVYYQEYITDYKDDCFKVKKINEIKALEIESLIEYFDTYDKKENLILIGDGVEKFKEELSVFSPIIRMPAPIFVSLSGKNVAFLGLNRYYNNDVMTYYQQKPYYHKKSQAEREYEEKHK